MNGRGGAKVAVVTGGGNGIGAATAQALARHGATVVVVDSGSGVHGEDLKEPVAAETAARIKAEGGNAMESTVSVTDRHGLCALFQQIEDDLGSVDIVVNTAGILSAGSFLDVSEQDCRAVLDVHFNGYLNVLSAALPIMERAGYGRVVGFTSGVGVARTAGPAASYGTAKRAVASLTWELGPHLPAGINLNALSPIAATRMVRPAPGTAQPAGLDLTSMPQADDMVPAAIYLAGDRAPWLRGRIVFSGGSELSVITPPRLIEVVRSESVADFGRALGTLVPEILRPAEEMQKTGGGSNPRIGDVFSSAPPAFDGDLKQRCLIVTDDESLADSVAAALRRWGMEPVVGAAPDGSFDAMVVITTTEAEIGSDWRDLIEGHRGTVERVMVHISSLKSAAAVGKKIRLIHLNGALTAPGRTAAQAVAQLARSVNDIGSGAPLDIFSISVETADVRHHPAIGQLVGRLACTDDGLTLRGAELVAGDGWIGLRQHPGPVATITFGGPEIPEFVDGALSRCF